MEKIIDLLKVPRTKTSAVFVGTGVVLSIIFLALIFVRIRNNAGLAREIDQLRNQIKNVQALTEDEKGLIEETMRIKRKYELVLEKLPKTAQIPQAIDQLTSGIESLHLKLISIEPKDAVGIKRQKEVRSAESGMGQEIEGELTAEIETGEETSEPDYIQIPIKINIRGSYIDIGHYLDTLRYLSRLVTIEEVNIGKTEEEEMLDVKLLVSVWYVED